MMIWIVLTAMVSIAVCVLTISLTRRIDSGTKRQSASTVLQKALSDIAAQETAGDLTASEASALQLDIKKRFLDEASVAAQPAPAGPSMNLSWLAIVIAALVALGVSGIYAMIGRPDLIGAPAPASDRAAPTTASHPMGDVAAMIGGLEQHLRQSPNDADGWRMLGWSYMNTGRQQAAATAYAHAASLDPKNPDYQSAEGEALVMAANGQVTASAVFAFRAAVALDAGDARARYYLALFKEQSGDHRGAMSDWMDLLKHAPPDAPWTTEVRQFVEHVAQLHHEDISKQLPLALPSASNTSNPPSEPTVDEVRAASAMPQADRQTMINGMVDQLAAKLKQSPNDADGWIRLMRARMVLGQTQAAIQAYQSARSEFRTSPASQSQIDVAAQTLQIPSR